MRSRAGFATVSLVSLLTFATVSLFITLPAGIDAGPANGTSLAIAESDIAAFFGPGNCVECTPCTNAPDDHYAAVEQGGTLAGAHICISGSTCGHPPCSTGAAKVQVDEMLPLIESIASGSSEAVDELLAKYGDYALLDAAGTIVVTSPCDPRVVLARSSLPG